MDKYNFQWGNKGSHSIMNNHYSQFELAWKGKRTLDFGCFWGYFPNYLLERKDVAVACGVDIIPAWEAMLERWPYWDHKSVPNLDLFSGDIFQIEELQDKKFDIITSAGTFFLLEPTYLHNLLFWFFDHLEPGGSVVFNTRTFFSNNAGDLHKFTKIPLPHVLFSESITKMFVESKARSGRAPIDAEVRYTNPMTFSSYVTLCSRVGFDIVGMKKGKTVSNEVYSRFEEKCWYFDRGDVDVGDITVHLKKPQHIRDISELDG